MHQTIELAVIAQHTEDRLRMGSQARLAREARHARRAAARGQRPPARSNVIAAVLRSAHLGR